MTAAGGEVLYIYMTEILFPSDNSSQNHAMLCRHSGAPLSPTPRRPQEKKEKRKRKENEEDKGKRQPGPEALTLPSR